ncbi:protein ubiquitination [Branchiostoma belcheri]|nr:protein ubiquitination [Branchiostoma belcheri]
MIKEQECLKDERITGSEGIVFLKDTYNGWRWQDQHHGQRLLRGLYRVGDDRFNEEFTVILVKKGLDRNLSSISVVHVLQEMRETREDLCDVMLRVRDEYGRVREAARCHRAVLAAYSTYFNAMLFGRFREGQAGEVTFEDISCETLRQLVNYAYTGVVTFTTRNVERVFHASSIFNLPFLANACCQYMLQNISKSHCLGLFHFAKTHFCEELAREARMFALEHLQDVVSYGGIEELTVDELEELLNDNSAHMWGEESLLEGAVRWLFESSTTNGGETDLHSLLQKLKIDLTLVNKGYLKFIMATEVDIKNSRRCKDVLEDAVEKIEALETAVSGHKLVLQFGGISGSELADHSGRRITTVDCFDSETNAWATVTELPQRLLHAHLNTTVLENDVYIVATFPGGGRKESEVWKYSCMHDIWRRLPDLQEPHGWDFVVQAAAKRVYALGNGRTLKSSEKCYEAFDPTVNKWGRIEPVPQTIEKACFAACMGKLYVMGHWGNGQAKFLVHIYDQHGQSWRTQVYPAFHGCKIQYHAATLGGMIYMMPLLATRQDFMCAFNAKKNLFEKVVLPTYKRLQCGMAATDDSIVVTGGRDLLSNAYATGNVEVFRPVEGCWRVVGRKPGLIRRGHTCVTVNGPGWMLDKLDKASGKGNMNANEDSGHDHDCEIREQSA